MPGVHEQGYDCIVPYIITVNRRHLVVPVYAAVQVGVGHILLWMTYT